ncbi:MAG: phospholipase D-like domain-containing protein [Phycisphaerae bacterium]
MDTNIRAYFEHLFGVPFIGGNRVEVLRNGVEIFPSMLEAIGRAESSVELLTFIYWTGEIARKFAHLLADRARDGLQVRVLLDAFGARRMDRDLMALMTDAGVDARWFRTVRRGLTGAIHRTHRKVLVCDNRVGFTGGVGIAKEWEGDARNPDEWRETHFRVEGPAVAGVAGAFWDNWLEVDQFSAPEPHERAVELEARGDVALQVMRSSSSPRASDAAGVVAGMLRAAQKSLRIATPYFVLDDVFRGLLCRTARRGVAIEVLIPGDHLDKRFEAWAAHKDIRTIMDEGIVLRRYQKTMLHTKIFLMDDRMACVGSANFNQRSLRQDDELMLLIDHQDVYDTLREHYEDDLQHAERVTDPRQVSGTFFKRVFSWISQPFRRQL